MSINTFFEQVGLLPGEDAKGIPCKQAEFKLFEFQVYIRQYTVHTFVILDELVVVPSPWGEGDQDVIDVVTRYRFTNETFNADPEAALNRCMERTRTLAS